MDAYARALGRLAGLVRFGVIPGLERIAAVMEALGNPEAAVPALHVAGTNGKGSTAAMAAALLGAAGKRVGLYTSPHLCRVTERIRIGDEEIGRERFAALLDRVLAAPGGDRLTFFEALTAIAFLYFSEEEVEAAVIEVGLGGRLDATNLCHPFATVITSIGLDHTEVLGSTTRAIAVEKAGIVKDGVPLFVARCDRDARSAIEARARAHRAPVMFVEQEFGPDAMDLMTGKPAWPALGLPGAHQLGNSVLALMAVMHAPDVAWSQVRGWKEALANVRWPGRLERFDEVILDCAHNPDGAAALAAALPDVVTYPVTLLCGVLADKDAAGVLAPLLPLVARVVCTRPPSPRARPASELAALASRLAPSLAVLVEEDPTAALALARWMPEEKANKLRVGQPGAAEKANKLRVGRVVCCGSIVLVGAVRALLTGEAVDPILVGDPAASVTG